MKSVFSVFRRGLEKSAMTISRSLGAVAGLTRWKSEDFEKMETALIAADFGVRFSTALVEDIKDRYSRGKISAEEDIFEVVKDDVQAILSRGAREIRTAEDGPTVIMLVGVNGSGKTTTAGKLAARWEEEGASVMLAACDTFRAAAVEQLNLWAERIGCQIVSSSTGADPSSVAFDAVSSARSKNVDYLILDTAGRQQTRKGLMEELAKMRRVISKILPEAPHETWLTIDAAVGTNALSQAEGFLDAAGITGIVITKLDGTGKGGMAVAVKQEYELPVFFAGFGEEPEDLQPFAPSMFAEALFPGDALAPSFHEKYLKKDIDSGTAKK